MVPCSGGCGSRFMLTGRTRPETRADVEAGWTCTTCAYYARPDVQAAQLARLAERITRAPQRRSREERNQGA